MIVVIIKEMKNLRIKNNKHLNFSDILSIETGSVNEVIIRLKSSEKVTLYNSFTACPDLIMEIKEKIIQHIKHGYSLLKQDYLANISPRLVSEYFGVPLTALECNALEELERFIGEPIPLVEDRARDVLGFFMEDRHVVHLSIPSQGLWLLPDSFRHLKYLKSLHLPNNHLDQFPEEIHAFGELQILDLWDNDINSIPEWIGTISRLQDLILGFNSLSDVPRILLAIKNLRLLDLSHNRFNSFPEEICMLRSLRYLFLQNNHIRIVPDCISGLENLKSINLEENEIEFLPDSILQLKNLTELHVEHGLLKNTRFPKPG